MGHLRSRLHAAPEIMDRLTGRENGGRKNKDVGRGGILVDGGERLRRRVVGENGGRTKKEVGRGGTEDGGTMMEDVRYECSPCLYPVC